MKNLLSTTIFKIENKEEFSFSCRVGLYFVFVSLFFIVLVMLFNLTQIRMNLSFIVASGFMELTEIHSIIEEYFFKDAIWLVIMSFIVLLVVFIFGFYLSKIMIRPFKIIALNCEMRREGGQIFYTPDFLSDLNTLTSFSMFFFKEIESISNKIKKIPVEIPKQFTGIHKPMLEKNFFINYFLIILIFSIISSYCLIQLNMEIRDIMTELLGKFRMSDRSTRYFIDSQNEIGTFSIIFFICLHILTYIGLGLHLYSKISTPAFAVFATLRSFLKGNVHNRIHLVGYSYLRDECRIINKYLEYIESNLSKKD